MEFNHQLVKVTDGQRTIRIPKEFGLSSEAVSMYWDGFGVKLMPDNARSIGAWRENAPEEILYGFPLRNVEKPS